MAKYGKDIIKSTIKKKKQDSQDYSTSLLDGQGKPVQLPQNPQTAPAVATAVQVGADPKILDKAKSMLNSNQFIGLCEAFVEKATGMPQKFASAYADWQANKANAVPLSQAKPGDKVFFAPDNSNGGYGHVGVLTSPSSMISATYNGVKQSNLDEWVKSTGQKILGVIPG